MSGIVVLADVALGYGSPQIPRLAASLSRLLNLPVTIIAPKGDAAAEKSAQLADASLLEISGAAPFGNVRFDIEFCLQAAREIDRLAPRWIVFAGFLGAPALLRMRHRPERLIFYGYEHTDGRLPWVERSFAGLRGRVSLAIYPEPHRAALDAPRLGLETTPSVVMLNGVEPLAAALPSDQRNGRFVYAGLIDQQRTHGDALLGGAFDALPIDVFGRLEGFADPAATLAALASRSSHVHYHGQQPADARYQQQLAKAEAALVAWAPLSESTFFACPNKFFEAIALGIPPVTAPHPQAASIVRQFDCGWVADGFDVESLRAAMLKAQQSFGTPRHAALVHACTALAQPHLSWARQEDILARAIARLAR